MLPLGKNYSSTLLYSISHSLLLTLNVVLLLSSIQPLMCHGDDSVLRVGVAQTDITPEKPVMLAGYASRKELSQGVHDPLSARVVVFLNNSHKLVLISTDLLGFYGNTTATFRKAIINACDLQPSELFLTSIHTHSAPTVTLNSENTHSNNVAYTQKLETCLIQSVKKAINNAIPVKLGTGSGSSPVGVNRREVVKDTNGNTRIELGRNPNSPINRDVQVLKICPIGQENISAVLFSYATHSTSLGPKNLLISGDVHGLAEQFVEKYFGNRIIAPAFSAAAGNIDPWYRVLPEFVTTNGWIPEPVLQGTMLGEEVVHALSRIKSYQTNFSIKTVFKTVLLPGKLTANQSNTNAALAAPAEFNLSLARIGSVALVGLGGEVFNEIGSSMKAQSPFPFTFIITHCNGTAGYLPTASSYAEGGYEVRSSNFAPSAAELVVKETVQILQELWK